MKKKFLIMAGLLLSLCLIVGCKKDEPIEQEANYAVNGGEQTTVTEEIDVDTDIDIEPEEVTPTVIEEESEEVVEEVEDYHITHDYSGKADVNEGNKELTNTNISIDGKLLSYPATVDDVIKAFGDLVNDEGNLIDTNNINTFAFYNVSNIETGYGYISFMFDEDGNVTYLDFSGEARDGLSAMTIALPTKIRFGSTVEDIEAAYKDYELVSSTNYKNGGARRMYKFSNSFSQGTIEFIINDYGVNNIIMKFD